MKRRARVMRKEGKERKTSMNFATPRAPGKGTKAMISASAKPRTRQPTVAPHGQPDRGPERLAEGVGAEDGGVRVEGAAAVLGGEGLLDDQREGVEEDQREHGHGRYRPYSPRQADQDAGPRRGGAGADGGGAGPRARSGPETCRRGGGFGRGSRGLGRQARRRTGLGGGLPGGRDGRRTPRRGTRSLRHPTPLRPAAPRPAVRSAASPCRPARASRAAPAGPP